MGFRCQLTNKHIHDAPRIIVTKTRTKEYPPRFREITKRGKKELVCVDSGGKGWEVVEEIQVDPAIPEETIRQKVGTGYEGNVPQRRAKRPKVKPLRETDRDTYSDNR